MLLGQTGTALRNPSMARDAYDHVLKLDPNNAGAMVGWAESDSMLREDHMIEGRGRELLLRAVQLQPDSQRGLWLLGISDFQQGRYADAEATWRLLQPQLEPGSSVAQAVAKQIEVAAARAASAPAPATSTPVPDRKP
jgi:cytochrome c-type biogenesis protein CcmH